MKKTQKDLLKENLIFVGTIYDSFEALEETLGKLKLEKPLFITHVAKMAFAEEVFKRVEGAPELCRFTQHKKPNAPSISPRFYN